MFIFDRIVVPVVRSLCLTIIFVPTLFFILERDFRTNVVRSLDQQSKNALTGRLPTAAKERPMKESFQKILRFDKWVRFKTKLLFTWYTINLIKQTIIIMLEFKSLAKYRIIDCFLIGRLAFFGRSIGATKYAWFAMTVFSLTYRMILVYGKPNFNFDYIHFILNGLEIAKDNEIKYENIRQARLDCTRRLSKFSVHGVKNELIKRSECKQKRPTYIKRPTIDYDCCYFTPNYLDTSRSIVHFNLRRNRTERSWRKLNWFIFSFGSLLSFSIVIITLGMYRFIGPIILTNIGFRMNYDNCYSWLKEQKLKHNLYYPEICSADYMNKSEKNVLELPFLMPFDDMSEPTWYGIARIFYDLIENHFFYIDLTLFFSTHTLNILNIISDSYINYKSIARRLLEIIHYQLSLAAIKNENTADNERSSNSPGTNRCRAARRSIIYANYQRNLTKDLEDTAPWPERLLQLLSREPEEPPNPITRANYELEITRTQSILADHFIMIRRYNSYVEFHISACLIIWIFFTSTLCIWMSVVGSREVALEFYVAFMVSFSIFTILLSLPASLSTWGHHLYKLITRTVALDNTPSKTRKRWISILRYHYPKPLHCFSLFQTTNLSSSFCLKLFSWMVTALLIVYSFLVNYNTDSPDSKRAASDHNE